MTFTPRNAVKFIYCLWVRWIVPRLNANFPLKSCLLGAVKLTKNADPHKYYHSRYGIGFDFCSLWLFPDFDWSKNVFLFGVDNSSSAHIDNKKKDILVLGKGLT